MDQVKLRDPLASLSNSTLRTYQDLSVRVRGYVQGGDSSESQLAAAKATLELHHAELAQPGVHHIAISAEPDANGVTQPLIYVVYLSPDAPPDAAAFIPTQVEAVDANGQALQYAFPVVIRQMTAHPATYGFCGGDQILGAAREFGICAFAFKQGDSNYFITNCHVVAAPDQSPIGLGAHYGKVFLGNVVIGDPLSTTGSNDMDAVIVQLESNVVIDACCVSAERHPIVDRKGLALGATEPFLYRASQALVTCFSPQLIPGKVGVLFNGRILHYSNVWKLTPQPGGVLPQPGHSGSILFNRTSRGLIVRGLVFGGTPDGSELWVFSADDVWRRLFN